MRRLSTAYALLTFLAQDNNVAQQLHLAVSVSYILLRYALSMTPTL
jgi:hypothetical protein